MISGTRLEDDSINLSRGQLVRAVQTWIANRTPVAVVRFGEGEGRLLAAEPADAESVAIAVRKLRRQTGLTFSTEATLAVKALVMHALDEADVLGIRQGQGFSDEHRAWMEQIADVYSERVAAGRTPAYIAHCMLADDLRAALPELLAGQRRISVVSCRDLRPLLARDHGIEDVAVYQIPSQYVMRDVDDAYEAALHDLPIWPDVHARLHAELTVRERGEIFLVGAGLFGKDLCVRIRERGGIALDMGSVLDHLAGKVTRGDGRPELRAAPQVPRHVSG